MTRPSPRAAFRRLSRADWVDGAIAFLAENNVDALRVDSLANQLGVTKGSFYWHFDSRETLLDAVLDTWRQRMINDIEAWISNSVGTPVGRLKRLLRIAISGRVDVPGGPLELTLRDWARRDPRVDAIVRRVDGERLEIVRKLYLEAGVNEEEAAAQAMLHMTFVAGGRSMLFSSEPEALEQRWKIAEMYLLPKTSNGTK